MKLKDLFPKAIIIFLMIMNLKIPRFICNWCTFSSHSWYHSYHHYNNKCKLDTILKSYFTFKSAINLAAFIWYQKLVENLLKIRERKIQRRKVQNIFNIKGFFSKKIFQPFKTEIIILVWTKLYTFCKL